MNDTCWVSKPNGYVEPGTYRFDENGYMILTTGRVTENGTLYYYENGRRTPSAGLIQLDGAYYYIDGAAKAAVSKTVWIAEDDTNGLMPEGSYTFDAEGKMILE